MSQLKEYKSVPGSYLADEQQSMTETCNSGDNRQGGGRCGWFGFSPKFVHIFNNPKGYLLTLCTLSLFQSMIAFGMISISLSTLEKRFKLTSFQSGILPATYEIATLAVALLVTYIGERGHKPRWVGIGSAIFSLGSVVFALPHFMTGLYEPGSAQTGGLDNSTALCELQTDNGTGSTCDDAGESSGVGVANYFWVFIIAQIIHGIGGSTLYTVGVTFMDESLEAKDFGLYLGFFNASNTAGPAIGHALGGAFLKIYTDFYVADSGLLTPDNPLWVGAWWLGFIISGILLFLTSLLMLGFPKTLPGSEEIALKKKNEVQRGQEFESGRGLKDRLKGLPRAFLNLITNIPYMFISFFTACQFFSIAVGIFGPKYLEAQFNLSSSEAAFYTGVLSLFAFVIGALSGGYIIKRLDLKFRGLVKLIILVNLGSIAACFGFLLKCPNIPMAGVTVGYQNSSFELLSETNITAACNSDCSCGTSFNPVCGSDGVVYYSPCHAGCTGHSNDDDSMYTDCSCIMNGTSSGSGTAQVGTCSTSCSSFVPFCIMIFLLLVCDGMIVPPTKTATIRCVPYSQRTFAFGLQTVIYSAFGLFPGPFVLGHLIDKTCLLWEESCDGAKSCWKYENSDLSQAFFLLVLLANIAGVICLVAALFTYRTPDDVEPTDKKQALET